MNTTSKEDIVIKKIKNTVFDYLEKNRFLDIENLIKRIKRIDGIEIIEIPEEEYEEITKSYIQEVMFKNCILLKNFCQKTDKIFVLRKKEAEFFTYLSKALNLEWQGNRISNYYVEKAKRYTEIKQEELIALENDDIIELHDKGIVLNFFLEGILMEYYTINTNVMNEIFNKITYVKFFEKMEKSEKIINELKNKASEIEIQFKETEEKIKKAEEKIKKTIEITENTKIDTLALLAIFVAIISIIYGNISVSKDSDIKNIIITNVSTVACISFIMGYIEIFIKNNKVIKKEYFISIAMIIIALALIVSAYYD